MNDSEQNIIKLRKTTRSDVLIMKLEVLYVYRTEWFIRYYWIWSSCPV